MAKRALLTKVMVQTAWVVIDDEAGTAEEQMDAGVVVPAADWPSFYDRHSDEFAQIQKDIANEAPPPFQAVTENRAQRRAKKDI